jgi:hypothetical protein
MLKVSPNWLFPVVSLAVRTQFAGFVNLVLTTILQEVKLLTLSKARRPWAISPKRKL